MSNAIESKKEKSNWVKNNPAYTIVLHTISMLFFGFMAAWFLQNDRKDDIHKTELAGKELEVDQYKSRNILLEKESGKLRIQNQKYYEWLSNTPSSLLFLEKKIADYSVDVDSLNLLVKIKDKFKPSIDVKDNQKYISNSTLKSTGESFNDRKTNVTIGISKIEYNNLGFGIIVRPNGEKIKIEKVIAGDSWPFIYNNKNYWLILDRCDFVIKSWSVTVKEI